MKIWTDEEILDIVGTTFKYIFEDESSVEAVVAAFDPKIGFTCLAASDELSDDTTFTKDYPHMIDDKESVCLIGVNLGGGISSDQREKISKHLNFIIEGSYVINAAYGRAGQDGGWGSASCSF